MEKAEKYLYDIQFSISLIDNFLKDIDNFDAYQNDIKTQSAVERQLAIIGEAINKLKQGNPTFTISNTKQIIDFRNRIIHSYDSIDNSIVWVIIKKHLPILRQEIDSLVDSE
jgi:uncharacterized protein with HEPN domain